MAFSEALAERIRQRMAQRKNVGEKRMFGGIGFLLNGNKWLLEQGVPPLTAAAWTYCAAGVVLLPWALRAKGLHVQRPLVFIGWLLAGSVVGPALYYFGLQLTSGVQGVLLNNLQFVFTALLAFTFFKERLTLPALCASFAVLAGAAWVSWPDAEDKWLVGGTLGNLLIALGYLAFATEDNLGRSLGRDIPPVTWCASRPWQQRA